MLSFSQSHGRYGRRQFLQAGALGLGGLSLANLLAMKAAAAEAGRAVTDKSVIFLFLHGGPPQTETFDPKMSAPLGNRSVTGETATKIPGVTFGGTMTQLASRADRLAVVRSYQPGNADHDIKPIVSKEHTFGANLGSIFARVAGANHPRTGMPSNAAIFPQSVDPTTGKKQDGFGKFESTGTIGASYAPFIPGADGDAQKTMKLHLPKERLDDRRALLGQLDQIRRRADKAELAGLDKFQQQAYQTIVGGVANAFDLSKEDPRTIAKYDTAPLVRPDQISRQWNNYNHYVDNAKSLGKLLLLARRMCENGCGFVTVTTNFVWDFHADNNNAGVEEGMDYCGKPLDHALSVFLDDLRERGLSEKILLVCCGEIGRGPNVNGKGGRDHWGNLGPLLFAGGGLKMGQAIGQSDAKAAAPQTEPITIPNVVSTVMHTLLDIGQVRLRSDLPVDLLRKLTTVEPIRELV